jgi:2,4-dienoyl-CoA reductase-like NADH-dependent reductase (Old Yellow Enzyme family)/thioredoxin reductase
MAYENVFAPIRIRGIDFKNRIELAPPSPNLAATDCTVTTEFVNHFRVYAHGGATILHVGNSQVDASEARDEERQLDLGTDACILPLSRFSEMAIGFGAHASMEINHIGMESRYAKTGKPAYSASPVVSFTEGNAAAREGRPPVPAIEMTHEKIAETVKKFADAALRCKKSGMDISMVHGGHANLIPQFTSALYNHRTDEYGGSLENRARFSIEVLDAVRKAVGPDFVIEFRISADEIHPDGMHFKEVLQYIEMIQDKVDILHVSAGMHSDFKYFRNWWQNYTMPREYNVHFAADVKKAFPNLLVATVGSIMSIEAADRIIGEGQADFVAMCRPLMADPEMPRKYATGHQDDHRPCLRCQSCTGKGVGARVMMCAVNPALGNETEFPCGKVPKAEVKKKVAVVGGGPAGIQAMLTLIERGHDVTLYEKTGEVGGNVIGAALPPFKIDMKDYLAYLKRQVAKAPARVLLNTEATAEMLKAENYDAVIIAVGADPIIPKLPGIDLPHVHWAPDAEAGKFPLGRKIVVAGAGAVGVEAAIHLHDEGHDVEIIEMADNTANLRKGCGAATNDILRMLEERCMEIKLRHKLVEVKEDRIVVETPDGVKEIECDNLLLALGMRPRWDVSDKLRHVAPETEVHLVGDAFKVATILEANSAAFKAAAYI